MFHVIKAVKITQNEHWLIFVNFSTRIMNKILNVYFQFLKGEFGMEGLSGLPGKPGYQGPRGFKGTLGQPGTPGFDGLPGDYWNK